MTTLKKALAALAALALLALPGCGGQAGSGAAGNLNPASPVTVTLWHYYVGENQQALEVAAAQFNETLGLEQGVIVEPVAMGSIAELESAVTDSAMGVINSKPMPQIFSSYPDKAMEIDSHDMLVDLADYFTEEERAAYVDDFLADGIFEGGRLLLLPIVKSTELMYVNATAWNAFAQAAGRNPDELSTWEALGKTARAYYEWSDAQTPDTPWDGTALMGFDSVANFIIVGCKQLGVDVISATGGGEGQAVLNETALRRVFDTYYTNMCLGYFGAVGKFRSDDIKTGDLAAYVGSSSSAAYFPTWIEQDNTQADIDFLPLAYPVFEGGEAYAIQQGAGMCVAKSTPAQQEGAALFLKWFTAAEENINFSMTTGYLPVQQAAYSSDAFTGVLDTLRAGDASQRNVAGVYEIALHQITESNTYAARPFSGSYDVRSILQSSLMALTETGRTEARRMQDESMGEAEILAALDTDARFEQWLADIRTELDALDIPYAA